MRSPTGVIRAWLSAHRSEQERWMVFWGVAWTVMNIGLVIFFLTVAAR